MRSKKDFVDLLDLDVLPNLGPGVAAALRRGTALSVLKRLAIVCHHDEELAVVLTAGSSVVMVRTPAGRKVASLEDLTSVTKHGNGRWIGAQNKCCSTISISGKLVAGLLGHGVRRYRITNPE